MDLFVLAYLVYSSINSYKVIDFASSKACLTIKNGSYYGVFSLIHITEEGETVYYSSVCFYQNLI